MSNPMCQCKSVIAYRVTAEDIPESDPETFVEFDVYESCGGEVSNAKREFLPGHDAKLKSVLQKAYRENGGDFAYTDGGMVIHANAMALAAERGWERFMTAAPKRKSRAKAKVDPVVPGPATGAVNEAPTEVEGFRPARVKVGRWWKDGVITLETSTPGAGEPNLVTVQYTDRKGTPQEVTLPVDSDKLEIG